MQKPWGGSTLADLGNSEKVLQQDQCGGQVHSGGRGREFRSLEAMVRVWLFL